MTVYQTFGPYTYTDHEVVSGRLDTIVSDLRRHGWTTYGITSRYSSWKKRTTFFLHCNAPE